MFTHLLKNEPTAVELTKEEYEEHRGIKPAGGSSADIKDVSEPVGEDSTEKYVSQVSGESTKKEIIAEILSRGGDFTKRGLMQKNKAELLDLL